MHFKYLLTTIIEIAIFGGLIYFICSVIPWGGWLSWVGIVILTLIFLVILTFTVGAWVIEAYYDDLIGFFKKIYRTYREIFEDGCNRALAMLFGK